jgi:acyl-CoA hydrolase
MENTKTPSMSSVESRYVVMPDHANHYGTAFGGAIMSWIDTVAVMAAQRHAEMEAVTLSVDRIAFISPINIGDHVLLRASVNYVGNSSMEVGVQVVKENPYNKERVRATTAYLTFVALGTDKRPAKVPRLLPETEDEIRRFENGKIRQLAFKELKTKLLLKKEIF